MIGDGDANGILRKQGYACLCLCVCATTLATWKRGRVFDRVFFLGTLKNCLPVFVSFFRERTYSIFLRVLQRLELALVFLEEERVVQQ